MTNLLTIKQLAIEFSSPTGPVRVIENVNLTLEAGETLGIVGESGSGKSVTASSIMRLLPKDLAEISDGDIQLKGQSIVKLSDSEFRKIRGSKISMIFQEPMTALNPVFKIGSQISEMILQHRKKSKKEAKAEVINLLREVGISAPEQIVNSYPHQLSGGMRQRIMIAMAIAGDPEVLIADEPTTALDVTIQAQVLELLKKIQRERGMSIILITHDFGVVAELCDRVCVMYAGQIVEQGKVSTIFNNPRHPYTQGLLKSIPQFVNPSEELYTIKGQVPAPNQFPKGCRFAPRCPMKMEICELEEPEMIELKEGIACKCHLYRGETD
ncbi:ABC transporter ATP-binding protein [Neobacillus mesonae]|uniref:ABC transporter ATP-binding protein n=1 Tax=Neobacillus mesonae TaxID=1193713 RepID=UPI002040D4C4|nr:ABC transporter ATP-binding protein [Neobacillus mesonae]MCM3568668.1 ABC transporter ATP-binding protein [Neobacillus mesonae]